MKNTTYDITLNGKLVQALTTKQVNALKAQGHHVIILVRYNTSECDYNSIEVKQGEW